MKSHIIHSVLRNRLFDYTRRNRLLYFKPSLKHLNLTQASVPIVENHAEISETSLFVWNDVLSKKIIQEQDIILSQHFSLAGKPYISSALNKIRLQANKDINEYGFNQLRLVVSFLNWYDVKNNIPEKIVSPLILLPVHLVKKKGIEDEFALKISDTEAEINPVLAGRLKDLYNIVLPEIIDLSETSLSDVFHLLQKQVQESSQTTLSLVDKPDVEQIHWKATQLHQKYNKNKEKKSSILSDMETDVGESVLQAEGTNAWSFDISQIFLGNFNYRKMSLVRDYDSLMDEPKENSIFNQLFDEIPRTAETNSNQTSLAEQYHVIQADPTQQAAVQFARKGESYIIQGPPGTGKSQTIVNLVSDFVSRGKKVLFVCEKRAAIDVVYFRLKQQQLDEFCSLIHDSQADKKAFVMDLKKTAEAYVKPGFNTSAIEHERNQVIYQIERELYAVKLYHSFMKQCLEKAGMTVRELLDIVIGTRKHFNGIANCSNKVSGYDQWIKYGTAIQKISSIVEQNGDYRFFAEHPLSSLNESCYFLYDRSNVLQNELSQAHILLLELSVHVEQTQISSEAKQTISSLKILLEEMRALIPFYDAGMLGLLEKKSEIELKFSQAISHIKSLEKSLADILAQNNFWIQKFTPVDTENALDIVQKYEGKFFSFLNGKYRRTKKAVSKSYNFSQHQIRPSYTQILKNLQDEHQKQLEFKTQKSAHEQYFKLGELYALESKLVAIFHEVRFDSIQYLKSIQHDKSEVDIIKKVQNLFEQLDRKLGNKIKWQHEISIYEVQQILQEIIEGLKDLPQLLPHLKELSSAEITLKNLILQEPYSPEQIEALLAKNSIQRFFDLNPELLKISGSAIAHHLEKIEALYEKFMQLNASYVRSLQRDKYKALIRASELSVAGKSEQEKEEKRVLSDGRKILQNEFDKTMRYKSIRELATLESGKLIRELKPVWLMSPLSVSDTLPMQTDYFDVVIFDEASQITVEEGIPSIYRAPQTIVVGDEMQMPPSHFFSSIAEEEPEEEIQLDADSFLQQGARKFPSVMLGWHYRSRHESLIGFSNSAFYENRLLTIPDRIDQQKEQVAIVAEKKEDAIKNLPNVLSRPISYHFLKHGMYEERTNLAEAEYIAEMVRVLMKDDKNMSIGVVAFSQEQQGEIEDAIMRLCVIDKDFEQDIEEEYKRVEDGQFMGIFFKNLENIQGDERDIIIMSTCYGYDEHGKMLMNFGPINRQGGEKRLNVIFSRAKQHMCVVSSIKHTDIKNEHNAGANYFKKYLHYAELVSVGDLKMADTVLRSVLPKESQELLKDVDSIVLIELKLALEKLGYTIETNIGQSTFKCHIGVKKTVDDESFIAGILIDDNSHYQSDDILETYLLKPQVLKNSGWNIIQVFSKDWYADTGKVLEQVIYSIENPQKEEANNPELLDVLPIKSQEFSAIENKFIRLESTENENHKFWEIKREGSNLILQYGKVQSKGTRMIKPFPDAQTAEKEMKRMIDRKIKDGYVEVRGDK